MCRGTYGIDDYAIDGFDVYKLAYVKILSKEIVTSTNNARSTNERNLRLVSNTVIFLKIIDLSS